MKIELINVKIKDLVNGFEDNDELGVKAYKGKLDVRPPYQRNFVYNDKQQNAVINSIMNDFPLNVMYWAKTPNGYEILDGQQRTLSICNYCNSDFAYEGNVSEKPLYFHNLPDDLKEKFLNYELTVYNCDGTDSEKLNWFETINIAGATLLKQELRNAVYSGKWTTDAKKYFSKINGAGDNLSKKYVDKKVNRQELLEEAIKWICYKEDCTIEDYMGKHQNDDDAGELYAYFREIINWIETYFLDYYEEMDKVNWGELYNKHKDKKLNANDIQKRIKEYMLDSEITNKKGIFSFVLDNNTKHLNLRTFEDNEKRSVYEKQKGICNICKKQFNIEQMEADHITPWSEGGRTVEENLQMLCRECNRRKSNN